MKRLFILLMSIGASTICIAQEQINGDYKKGALNIALPKTPESAGFERYGNIPVNEATGALSLNIPVYNLKANFLQVPISLSYTASGVRVSQEASWVGLGFDLIAGGRITVDVKGTIDNDGVTAGLIPGNFQYQLGRLLNRIKNSTQYPQSPNSVEEVSVYTYASTCQGCDTVVNNNIPDDWATVNAMAQFGVGEPDIFHANFLGQSLTFYFDRFTGEVNFIGEKSLVKIQANRVIDPLASIFHTEQYQKILDWVITDNKGVKYYFAEREDTEVDIPSYGGMYGKKSTTAWLLTKIVHPTGEEINFTYTNFGNSYPTFSWSASNSSAGGPSRDIDQYATIQSPQYLTKIESNDIKVEFLLSYREDLKGTGAKKLNTINIVDKANNQVRNKIDFDYEYFNANHISCYTNTKIDISQRDFATKRLKLKRVYTAGLGSKIPPYEFDYYSTSIPDKYSFSQDHWGYYNGADNTNSVADPCSPQNLIPAVTDFFPGTTFSNVLYSNYETFISSTTNYHANRNCNAAFMASMTMKEIKYPTGGKSILSFEPHSEIASGLIGGGLRVKSVSNYNLDEFAGKTDYEYEGGVYKGRIRYQTLTYQIGQCYGDQFYTTDRVNTTISSNGILNEDDNTIIYSTVSIFNKDRNGISNGYIVKTFKANSILQSNSLGCNEMPAHWPTGVVYNPITNSTVTYINTTESLFTSESALAPTPQRGLNGKLLKEEYFNSTNQLIKSVEYDYLLGDYKSNYYSVKAFDNRMGGSDSYGCPEGYAPQEFEPNGVRRYTVYVSPAKSYYVLTNKIIEKTYDGPNKSMTTTKHFTYNDFYQPEEVITENSDGTTTIQHTTTLASISRTPLNYPLFVADQESDSYTMAYRMRLDHIYDLPVEEYVIKRGLNGIKKVLSSKFTAYKRNTVPYKVYTLENSQPLVLDVDFHPANFESVNGYGEIKKDDGYKLQEEAKLNALGLMTELTTIKDKSAFIWDNDHGQILSQCINAAQEDISYTSFETAEKGGWAYMGTPYLDFSAPTGYRAYHLSSGAIGWHSPVNSKESIIAFWKKGSVSVNGQTSTFRTGTTVNGWTYVEFKLSPTTDITISGTGDVDELRLFPSHSIMTTYTYDLMNGITSQTDANGRSKYFDYDGIGRLTLIRDQDKNVIKKLCYGYDGQTEDCSLFGNDVQSVTVTKNDCPDPDHHLGGQLTYTIPADTYYSTISKQEANQKALSDIEEKSQPYVNEHASPGCLPASPIYLTNNSNTPYTITLTNTTSGVASTFTENLHPGATQLIGKVPPATYDISLTPTYGGTGSGKQLTYNSTSQYGTNFSISSYNLQSDLSFVLQPLNACTFLTEPGWNSLLSDLSPSNGEVTFNIIVVTSANYFATAPYAEYKIGSVEGTCLPAAERTITVTETNRSWQMKIKTNGDITISLLTGQAPASGTPLHLTGSYSL